MHEGEAPRATTRKWGRILFEIGIALVVVAVVLANRLDPDRRIREKTPIFTISLALDQYRMDHGVLPPDTGFPVPSPGMPEKHDPCSLWRHLCVPVHDPRSGTSFGPYLEWEGETLTYDDALRGTSRCLLDPWGTPYGYRGSREGVLHNRGMFDLFSCGPDGVTACDNGADDDGDGAVDEADEWRLNGDVGDDVNNWTSAAGG